MRNLRGTTDWLRMNGLRCAMYTLCSLIIVGWVASCTSDLSGPDPNTPAHPSAASLGILTEPGDGASGAPLSVQPVIEVYDADGALVAADNQTVVNATLVAGGGILEGGTSVRAENGVVTFTDLAVRGTVGQWSLQFSATDLPAITSAGFAIAPGVASPATAVVTVSESAVEVGGAVVVQLQAADAEGNHHQSGGLTVAISTSGGTSQGTIGAVTDGGDGTYSATFTGTVVGTATTVGAKIDGEAVSTSMPTITVTSDDSPPPASDTLVGVPLIDMAGTYLGFEGGLYPGGLNTVPRVHLDAGLSFASQMEPLNSSGVPDAGGTVVLMSLGMSNTRDHWDTFMSDANADPDLSSDLVLVQGAQGGQAAAAWEDWDDNTYDTAEGFLSDAGVTEEQVQTIWVLQANPGPTVSLPDANADAFTLVGQFGHIVRAAKTRYPNLKQIFFSSRMYSCARDGLNPEPYAYESGFSVKWLIEAQITQMETGVIDPVTGDLNYDTGVAPWLGWSAYLWADGPNPRSDGLVWLDSDLQGDCTHPAGSGTAKSSALQLEFFKTATVSKGWFLQN